MTLRADVTTDFVAAQICVEPGEVVALVGPNGAGKTSLLRALTGLLPASGSIVLDGIELVDVPVPDRRIGWLPQAPTLFAHLSARDNVGFALRAQGASRSRARGVAQELLDQLGVGDCSRSRPAQLSGGQVARVALARALATGPKLLLLDEPLASLDSSTRDDVRRLLRATLSAGTAPVVVVTHDPVDVVALADSVVLLEHGRVVQTGSVGEIAAAPRSGWVAGLMGQNAWRGTTDSSGLVVGAGHVVAAEPLGAGLEAMALCEPSAITLHRRAPDGSARTVLHGPVTELRSLGGRVRVSVASVPPVVAEVTASAAAELELTEGVEIWAALKATEVRLVAL